MKTGERFYYIERWSDEILPCQPTLEGWATWLSKPDINWRRDAPAEDGETFPVMVLTFQEDVVAIWRDDAWHLSKPIGKADFVAVRWSEGGSWEPDSILWGDDMDAAVMEWLAENADDDDARSGPQYIAVAVDGPPVMLTYRSGPPPSMQIEGAIS